MHGQMDDFFLAAAVLAVLLALFLFFCAKRYHTTVRQKEVYRVAFKMEDQPVADTTESMPQLIDTDDVIIAYSDVESEHII